MVRLGEHLFENCTSLTYVDLTEVEELAEIPVYCFTGCTTLTSVDIPASVTKIKPAAFDGCTSLKQLNIPPSGKLSDIGIYAFRHCESLESLDFPASLQSIQQFAFDGCKSVASIRFRGTSMTVINGWAFRGCSALEELYLPDHVREIYTQAFAYCTSLKVVAYGKELPLVLIGNQFDGCDAIELMIFPVKKNGSDNEELSDAEKEKAGWKKGVTATLDIAYDNDDNALIWGIHATSKHRTITLPAKINDHDIVTITERAAYGDTALTELVFPEDSKVSFIGHDAFKNCTSLESVTIPASVKHMDQAVFAGCASLSSVTFNTKNLESLGGVTFMGCTSLESITLPEGMTTLYGYEFYNCTKLKNVYLPDTMTDIAADAFGCGEGKHMAIETMRMPNSSGDFKPPSDRDFFESWIVNQARDTFKFEVTYGSYADAMWFEPHIKGDPQYYPIMLPESDREYVPVAIGDEATHLEEANDVKLTWDARVNWTGEQEIPKVTATRWLRTTPVGSPHLTVEPVDGDDCTSVGTHHIKVMGNAPYFTGYRILEYEIVKSNIDDVQMMEISPDCVWDNKKWEPDPGFYTELSAYEFLQDEPENGDHIYNLISDVDYTIVGYEHNKMAGDKATITIEGKGHFQGKKTFTFTIYPADLDNTQVKVPDQVYTGEAITPVPSEVMLIDRDNHYTVALEEGVDYIVDTEGYENNRDVGTATLTLKPVKDCEWLTGSKKASFNIVQADLSEATVEAVPDQTYTGADITPALKVSSGEGELVQDRDYTVSWENNRNVGTATATLKAKSAGCTGEQTITFEIVPRPVTVTPIDAGKSYGDSDPVLTATVKGTVGSDLVVYKLARELGENAGDYTITASGLASQGNYTVTFATGTFTIERASIGDVSIEDVDAVFFDGAAHEPEPAVTWRGKALVKDKDYLLAYADNVNAGQATVIVRGVGNYKDEMRPKFTILPLDLRSEGCQVLVGIQMHTGQPLTPHPARVTAPGRNGTTLVLEEGTDYMVYEDAWHDNVDVGTGSVKISGIGNYCESREGSFAIVNDGDLSQGYMDDVPNQVYTGGPIEPALRVYLKGVDLWLERDVDYTATFADNVDVGTAKATVTGAGSLHGSLDATFDILPADFSKAVATAPDQVYSGAPLEPAPRVTWNEMLLEEGRDYEVSGYENNEHAGTATVTVTGKGNFEGTVSGTFEIAKRPATITVDSASKVRGEADPEFTGTVDGLVDAGDLGEVSYKRTNGDEAPGTYEGVLDAEYTANADYDVSIAKGDFTIVPGYSVRFDDNVPAHASTACSGSMDDQHFACDERKALSGNGYFLPGYEFAGWNTKADGSGTAYADEAEVEGLAEDGGVVVLYAQWSSKPYTIEYWSDDAGSQKHVQTAYFDRPGKLDVYSDRAFGWDSGGKTLHGWTGRGFGSFYGDGEDFCNLCGAPDAEGNVADAVIIADWVQNGQIVVTVTKDDVPQEGLADHLELIQGGVTFTVPIAYANGRYVFDPSQAITPGGQTARLPEGEYDLRFEADGYPPASAQITYGEEHAVSVVFDYYTVSLAKDAAYADANDVEISGGVPVAGEPNTVVARDGDMLGIKTTVQAGYRFIGYSVVGVAPVWEGGDPTKAEQTIKVQGKADIAAHVAPIEYAVTVVGGTADKATAHVGDTVTITADTPEPGKAFVQWAHVDGVDFENASSAATSFTMPAKDVTETAVFAPIAIKPIGDKVYTGEPIEPIDEVKVSLDGVDLILTADDYEITFDDNMDVGTATVTVTMKDPRAGSATTTFEITPAGISEATVTADAQVYDGTEHEPVPTVTWKGKALDTGTDFEITGYEDNVHAGSATVTVTGKGNFEGTASGTFEIAKRPASIKVDSASKIQGEADPEFTGTVDGLVDAGDLGEIRYIRTNDDEAPGTYEGVLDAEYTANADYDVSVTRGDFTITALKKKGTLTFDCGGGTIDGKASLTIEANVGDVITIPEAPVRDGYTFKYWKGSEYYPGDKYTVEGDHTFTAVWEKKPGGGGNGGTGSPGTGDAFGGTIAALAATAACALCLAILALRQRPRRTPAHLGKHAKR